MSLLTVNEAAAQLRVHPATIRRMIRRGDLAAFKVGPQYRIDGGALIPTLIPKPQPMRAGAENRLTRFARPEWRRPLTRDSQLGTR